MSSDFREERDKKEMQRSILFAFILHGGGFLFVFLWMNMAQAKYKPNAQVFTVTIEGGEVLGGVSQVPKQGKEAEKPPIDAVPDESLPSKASKSEEAKKEEKKEQIDTKAKQELEKQKELERLTLVEELEKKKKEKELLEKKKKEEELKKKKEAEEKKKQLEEKKRKDKEDAAKKLEEDKKKKLQEEIDRKRREEREREQAKKDRDKRLSELAREIRGKKDYEGESVRAGGQGFGGARIGGTGGGGGTLAPYAKVAYQNELLAHLKSGWRWMQRTTFLSTFVEIKVQPNGDVTSVRMLRGSGNSHFDDSVLRAVKKASPVPQPPKEFYQDFSTVVIEFNNKDN